MPLDWSIGELAIGLSCYKREEFFDAHEHWENIWRQSQGPEKPFLQALIQVAGAFHHYRRRNLRGCQALLRGAMRRLAPYPERFGGVLLAPLRQELENWLLALEKSLAPVSSTLPPREQFASAPTPPAGVVCFPEAYPKIQLDDCVSEDRDSENKNSEDQNSENRDDSDRGDSQE